VSTIDELIDSGCDLVISAVAPRLGFLEDKLKDAGITVVSISPYKRQESALCVLEANHAALRDQLVTALEEQVQKKDAEVAPAAAAAAAAASPTPADIAARISAALPQPLPLVKSPNCVCCGTSTVLSGLSAAFGKMDNVSVTTFQSLSGRGDSKYPAELVVGNVFPLRSTTEPTEELIGEELATVLRDQLTAGRDSVSVAAYRVSVQRGHLVDVRVRFEDSAGFRARLAEAGDDKASRMEVVYAALEQYRPLEAFREHLPSVPEQPIIVDRGAGCPRPKSHHLGCDSGGFSVTVGNAKCIDGPYDVCLSLVVDNLVKGALGAALQLLEYTLMVTEKKH
jgi:aspartate-semialdehyde dehydrogenase